MIQRGSLRRLYHFELDGKLPAFIQHFLADRKIKVKIGSTLSEDRDIDEGVPQGSVLSCTFFAVAMDSVVEKLTGTQGKVALYVDDLTIYASGTTSTAE